MYAPPVEISTEHLTEFCRIVARGEGDGLIALCEKLDAESLDPSSPYCYPVSKARVHELAEGSLGLRSNGLNERDLSIVDGLMEYGFRRAVQSFYGHYKAVPYHSVYLRPLRLSASSDPFLPSFYGFLHDVAARTLDIYFRIEDLLPVKNGKSMCDAAQGHRRNINAWWSVDHQVGSRATGKWGPAAEDSLLVWDKTFEPAILPLGRYTPPVRASAIAAMVTALEAGIGVEAACNFATSDPARNLEYADAEFNDPESVRKWLAALKLRHQEHPQAGYDEVARIVKQLLLPSPLERAYASTRLRLVVGLITGGIIIADRVEVLIDIPEAWRTFANWF